MAREAIRRTGRRWLRIVLIGLASLMGLLLVGALVTYLVLDEERPVARPGKTAEAEALAQRFERTVDLSAWAKTGAVRWTFAGRRKHLWDRTRELSRVEWGDIRVLQRLDRREGRVWENGREVTGARRQELVADAWAHFCNDSFWLNPLAKLRDPGVTLGWVEWRGEPSLLVSYGSGGVTPGDAYLWLPGEGGLPRAWRMWVSVIPVGGLEASWEGWKTLATGARVATRHEIGPLTLRLSEVVGATGLEALVGDKDPFAPLVGQRGDAR